MEGHGIRFDMRCTIEEPFPIAMWLATGKSVRFGRC